MFVFAGCAQVHREGTVRSTNLHAQSLSQALRDAVLTVHLLSEQDRSWLIEAAGFTQSDLEGLDDFLGEAYLGPKGSSFSGPWGDGIVYPQTKEERLRAIAARERNRLLAEFVEREEINILRDAIRAREEWRSLLEQVSEDVEDQ